MAPFIILMSPKGKKWCTTAIVIVALGISALLNQVVYPAAGVISLEDKVDTYCIMFQQTAKYVQEHSGDVTPKEREVLDKVFDYEELQKAYEPHLADWVKNCLRKQEGSTDDPTLPDNTRRQEHGERNPGRSSACRHPATDRHPDRLSGRVPAGRRAAYFVLLPNPTASCRILPPDTRSSE